MSMNAQLPAESDLPTDVIAIIYCVGTVIHILLFQTVRELFSQLTVGSYLDKFTNDGKVASPHTHE